MKATTLDDFLARLRAFVAARGWERYHTPRSLATSIAIETGELLEHVQWLTDEEITEYLEDKQNRTRMAEEVADVLIYALMLANRLGYHPLDILNDKLTKNGQKYPPNGS